MVWGILRVAIFGVAFLIGTLAAGGWKTAAFAPAADPDSAELSNGGASVVVSCLDGDPTVQHVSGTAALEVKCSKSKMHIVHSEQRPVQKRHQFKVTPSAPIAAVVSTGRIDR